MRSWVIAIALLAWVGPARADDPPKPKPNADAAKSKPWAVDVPEANQTQALTIYNKANSYFEQAQYKEAYEQYAKALALWDHPAIRYNAAVCLINLDRPVEAYESLVAALRYGEDPLGPELYKQGLNYRKLLSDNIAVLEVRREDPDAEITVDGKELVFENDSATRNVAKKGEHQLVAAKPGYQTERRVFEVKTPKAVLVIKLRPLPSARKLTRRWPKWIPWPVVASGAAIALVGVPLFFDTRAKYARYDKAVGIVCGLGCSSQAEAETIAQRDYPEFVDDVRLRGPADRERWIMRGAFIVGGTVAAAGIVLALLNQPRLAAVTPAVGADHVGLAFSAAW